MYGMDTQTVRLQKAIADLGLASRRKAEELITLGKVRVNGQVVSLLGTKVDPACDKIEVDASGVEGLKQNRVVIMLNKPVGFATTRDEGEGRIVTQLIADHPRAKALNPVGRLDRDSRGLLLFTDDGVLQYALMDPERHLEKEYEVFCNCKPNAGQLAKMAQGLLIDGIMTRPCKIKAQGDFGFRIILTEGRNRQIRKMATKVGLGVVDLQRLRQGPVLLGGLPSGKWRMLSPSAIAKLEAASQKAGTTP
jgi:23S rRNA pseudouridine2605 synthase